MNNYRKKLVQFALGAHKMLTFNNNKMKRVTLLLLTAVSLLISECRADNPGRTETKTGNTGNVVSLTDETFKKKIFNYEVNKEWKFEGDKPALIDFFAVWCGPCRQLSPLVEEIAKEYAGKIDVYQIDTDQERALSTSMGISGLPTLLFIPLKGKPQISVGVLPKATLDKAVNEILLTR